MKSSFLWSSLHMPALEEVGIKPDNGQTIQGVAAVDGDTVSVGQT